MTDQDHIAHLEAELAAKDRQVAHLREQVAATAAVSALADPRRRGAPTSPLMRGWIPDD